VREANLQVEQLALHGGAVTDADQLQLDLVALGNADHHVVQQGTHGTREHLVGLDRLGADGGNVALDVNRDASGQRQGQGRLGALDGGDTAGGGQLHTGRQLDGILCDA